MSERKEIHSLWSEQKQGHGDDHREAPISWKAAL